MRLYGLQTERIGIALVTMSDAKLPWHLTQPAPRFALTRRMGAIGTVAARRVASDIWLSGTRRTMLHRTAEQLGPSWVKLGQLVAASPGTFPPRLGLILQGLHDGVKPQPIDVVLKTVAEDLGDQISRLEIDPEPIAAGSVAQVYRATLDGSKTVAVKVQRSGILDGLAADLRLLRNVAGMAVKVRPRLESLRLVAAIDDLGIGLERELDFRKEAEAMGALAPVLATWDIKVPVPFLDLCTSRVVVMEFVEAVAVRDHDELVALGAQPEKVLHAVLGGLLESAFVHGCFHADGHGGNVLVGPSGQVVMVDFGIVGFVETVDQQGCAEILLAVFTNDFTRFGTGLLMLQAHGLVGPGAGEAMAKVAAIHLASGDFSQIRMGTLLKDALETASQHGFPLPSQLVLLFKQILYFDGLARVLAPNFDLFEDAKAFVPMLEAVSAGDIETAARLAHPA